MSDNEKPDDAAKPAAAPEAAKQDQRPPAAEPSATTPPPNRDDAVNRLRGDASELASVRFQKIVDEGIGRHEGTATVNVFHGDFTVDGDFVSGGGPARKPAARRAAKTQLDPKDLAELTRYFVEPPGFADGVRMLADTNLIVLSGPGRTGRYTRAVATLSETLRETKPDAGIFLLNGPVLGNMAWRPPANSGLLVVDQPKNNKCAAESVTDEWLTRASERLIESGSYLVVVTGPVGGTLATAARAGEFVLDTLEPADPMAIVLTRVAGEWPGEAELDERLTAAGLRETLAERDDPQFATRAAAAVIDGLRSGADLEDVVAKLSNPEDQVREWLDRDPDLAEVAFVFATAVLEGGSYLSVADAAVTLYRQISSSSATLTPRYLRDLRAERDWIERVDPPSGPSVTSVLRFKHARLRQVVLAVVWFELDGARDKILDWLKKLATHTDVEVRARAAQAAGMLADNDFEHAVHRYLLPWGTDRSAALRQSAAYGLNVAAATLSRHTESAWAYIEQWADLVKSTNARNLPATAGLAAGGRLGVENPRRALRVLHELVSGGNWSLLEPVAISTQTLLEAGRGDDVLDALLEWSEPGADEETVDKALMMFAFAVTPEDPANQRPLLMSTAADHREALPQLWGRALASKSVRPLALDALRSWLRIVDRDDSVQRAVLYLVADIADQSPKHFERMVRALEKWALDANDPSKAAARFHDELVEASEEV